MSITALVSDAAEKFSDNLAIVFDNGQTSSQVTYCELQEKINQVADQIVKHCEEYQNNTLGIYGKIRLTVPSILLGVLHAGGSFIWLDSFIPNMRLKQMIDELELSFIIVDSLLLKDFQKKMNCFTIVPSDLESYVLLKKVKSTSDTQYGPGERLAYVITTSGTTGCPKYVKVPHTCILPNITHLREKFRICPEDLVVMVSPLTFDPSMVEMFMTLSSGATLLMIPDIVKRMPDALLSILCDRNKVTVMQCTPSFLNFIGTEKLRNILLCRQTSLRILAVGGEPFPYRTLQQVMGPEIRHIELYNLYGITEVSCWASCKKVVSLNSEVSLGEPLEGTVLDIPDLEQGTSGVGELYIGGESRMCLIDKESHMEPRRLRASGDLVYRDKHGTLFYRGRRDEQTKRHGMRLNPAEIGQILVNSSLTTECCALVDHEELDKLYVCVVGNDDMSVYVKDVIKQNLPVQYQPDHVITIKSLPNTKHGKIDKVKLLELCRSKGTASTCSPNVEQIKTTVSDYFKDILNFQGEVTKERNTFLELGGDSFNAINFVNYIEELLNQKMPLLLDKLLSEPLSEVFYYINFQCGKHASGFSAVNDNKRNINSTHSVDAQSSLNSNTQSSKKLKVDLVSYPDLTKFNQLADLALLDIRCFKCSKILPKPVYCLSRCSKLFNQNQMNHCSVCLARQTNIKFKTVDQEHLNRLALLEKWKYDTGKCVDASPLITGESLETAVVFIGSHSRLFSAVKLSTGKAVWTVKLGDRIESSACVSACGNHVIVGCYDGCVYTLDKRNGDVHWKYRTEDQVKCSPCVDAVTEWVFVGSHDKHIHALNIKDKRLEWKTCLGSGSVFSSPCVSYSPHLVLVADLSGIIHALLPKNGSILWSFDCHKPVFSSLSAYEEGIVFGCVDNRVIQLSYQGIMIWSFHTDAPVFSSPTLYLNQSKQNGHEQPVSEPRIIIGSHDHHIYCLTSKGDLLWKTRTGSPVYSSPSVFLIPHSTNAKSYKESDNLPCLHGIFKEDYSCDFVRLLTVADTIGNLYILNADDGSILISEVLHGEVFSSPVVCEDLVVVGCRNNNVYCFQIQLNK